MSKASLIEKFKKLNIKHGDIVYIESQISPLLFSPIEISFLIKVLIDYLGSDGTIVSNLNGFNTSINYYDIEHLEGVVKFNMDLVHVYSKSKVASYIATLDSAKISSSSFYPYVAVGKYAKLITNGQSFSFPNGVNSPIARLYELRAKALLLDHDIRNILLNDHAIDSNDKCSIEVNNGVSINGISKYLKRTSHISLFSVMYNEKKYKELFRYVKHNDNTLLSLDVRDYVDYCNSIFERGK